MRRAASSGAATPGRGRLLTTLLVVALAPLMLAACDFSSPVATRVRRLAGGRAPMLAVTQTLLVHLDSARLAGVTSRPGQVLRQDCSTTVIYAFNERVTTYLTQLHTARLRSAPLPVGTSFDIRCDGALVLELPAGASRLAATAMAAGGGGVRALPVRSQLGSLPLARGRRLTAEPGTRLALVSWPSRLRAGVYRLRLAFELPAGPIREKAMLAASVGCGRASYLQPILPGASRMAELGFLTIAHSRSGGLAIPRSSQREGSQSVLARRLWCSSERLKGH